MNPRSHAGLADRANRARSVRPPHWRDRKGTWDHRIFKEVVEDDEYGLCQNCEKSINQKRLAAIPWARYCLDCQELVEKGLLDGE